MASERIVPVQTDDVQRSRLALRLGGGAGLDVDLAVTSSGLLAIGALVSMILLSTAVIVSTARTTSG